MRFLFLSTGCCVISVPVPGFGQLLGVDQCDGSTTSVEKVVAVTT